MKSNYLCVPWVFFLELLFLSVGSSPRSPKSMRDAKPLKIKNYSDFNNQFKRKLKSSIIQTLKNIRTQIIWCKDKERLKVRIEYVDYFNHIVYAVNHRFFRFFLRLWHDCCVSKIWKWCTVDKEPCELFS